MEEHRAICHELIQIDRFSRFRRLTLRYLRSTNQPPARHPKVAGVDWQSASANAFRYPFGLSSREVAANHSRIADRRPDDRRNDDGAIDEDRHRPTDMTRS